MLRVQVRFAQRLRDPSHLIELIQSKATRTWQGASITEACMRLYHFTSLGHLPVILATGGLWRSEIPVGSTGASLRATWFTTDPDAAGHGLDGSGVDKRAVRIVVEIEDGANGAAHWLTFTRGKLSKDSIRRLVHTGGGQAKAETWWIHPKQIPPEDFVAIEFRQDDGTYSVATPEQIAVLEAHEGMLEAVEGDLEDMRAKLAASRQAA